MTSMGILQIVIYLAVLLALAKPLGVYMARVYQGGRCGLEPVLGPLERGLYRLAGVSPDQEMNWKSYALALLLFNLLGGLAVYLLQRLQGFLPLNPEALGAVAPDLAFNTAISFATNTNWQGYSGETTMSYLTQMLALTVQNFLSAATGMACLAALIRGLERHEASNLGNFWVDMVRSTLYILLPLSLVLALLLVSQGVVQTFSPYQTAQLLQPTTYDKPLNDDQGKPLLGAGRQAPDRDRALTEQIIAVGPAASQVAIKQLGTNGGGFFNANSAHPLENPTPLSNFLEMLAILLIPAALCYTFGSMVGDKRQGWALLAAMTVLFIVPLLVCTWAEQAGNPRLASLGANQQAQADPLPGQGPAKSGLGSWSAQGEAAPAASSAEAAQPGGNMEGKEARFGIANSTSGPPPPPPPPTAPSTPCTTPSPRWAAWSPCG